MADIGVLINVTLQSYETSTNYQSHNTTENATGLCPTDPEDSEIWPWVLSVLLYITAIVTLLGNAVVMATFFINRRLLKGNFNVFLLNLTVTDIAVSTAIPLYGIRYFMGYWPFGRYLCAVWIFCDWGMTFASVYTLVMISVDRYWAVCWSHHYRANNTRRRMHILIAAIWLLVLLLWLPAFIDDRVETLSSDTFDVKRCSWSVRDNKNFAWVMAVLGYHLPSLLIVYCYIRVFAVMRRSHVSLTGVHLTRMNAGMLMEQLNTGTSTAFDSCRSSDSDFFNSQHNSPRDVRNGNILNERGHIAVEDDSGSQSSDKNPGIKILVTVEDDSKDMSTNANSSIIRKRIEIVEEDSVYDVNPSSGVNTTAIGVLPTFPTRTMSSLSLDNMLDVSRGIMNKSPNQKRRPRSFTEGSQSRGLHKRSPCTHRHRSGSNPINILRARKKHISNMSQQARSSRAHQMSKHRKDYKLFIRVTYIILAYLICWIPFHIVFDLELFDVCVHPDWYSFATLMCYINSTLNPILYALGSPKMKEALKRTINCCKK